MLELLKFFWIFSHPLLWYYYFHFSYYFPIYSRAKLNFYRIFKKFVPFCSELTFWRFFLKSVYSGRKGMVLIIYECHRTFRVIFTRIWVFLSPTRWSLICWCIFLFPLYIQSMSGPNRCAEQKHSSLSRTFLFWQLKTWESFVVLSVNLALFSSISSLVYSM